MLVWKNTKSAFERDALPHLDEVYRFAVHLCGNEAEAEDLTQDCFLHAFRKFHQFRPGTNVKAWLFRITHNVHVDRARERSRKRVVVENELIEDAAAVAPVPEGAALEHPEALQKLIIDDEEIFYDLFGDEVNRFLSELPREFRLALVLCDVYGFTYQEIAEILGCPMGTVRSRIARARSHLRTALLRYAKGLGYAKSEDA
jgi:RNA polymerase sigma-70 factor (ECF subfamily)